MSQSQPLFNVRVNRVQVFFFYFWALDFKFSSQLLKQRNVEEWARAGFVLKICRSVDKS
jgi:hypothetical protein